MKTQKIELCAASITSLEIAKEFNFDRVELCQNLENGGLTPSYALIERSLVLGLETHVLIRPRIGSFVFSEEEIELMLKDIEKCAEIGVHGVVVGALNSKHDIDISFLKALKSLNLSLDFTFHRAFDDVKDWKEGLKNLIEFGFIRVLSSGGESNVDLGLSQLKEMKNYVSDRLEIMAGGGVNLSNIKQLVNSNVDAIHFSGTRRVELDKQSKFSESILVADKVLIKELTRLFTLNKL